jgi:hypothetical protein
MSFCRKLILIAAGLLLLPAILPATPLEPFIDLQQKGLTLISTGAGTEGMGAGSRTLTVTINGTVRFALLYWAGRQRPCDEDGSGNCITTFTDFPLPYRDQEIIFNGTSISGTIIGTEAQPVSGGGPILNIGYFADVTSLVSAAGPGTHGFTVSDGNLANNLWRWNGVSLVVGYIDPADPNTHRVLVWDGLDFAFGIDPTPGDNRVTAPANFNHGMNMSARMADVHLGSGDGTVGRPDRIDISNNPSIVNGLDIDEGEAWDNDVLPISIPAGVGTTTVQLVSAPNTNPDSMLWIYAALRVRQLDTAKPTCPLTLNDPGPPARIEVTFRDTGTGLAELLVTKSENADTVVPPFTVGTTDPVVVSATKIDQTQRARVEIRATDLAGNVAFCDPILTLISRADGLPEDQTFTDVPHLEHVVTVTNGTPGFKRVEVIVNGKKFKAKDLRDGEVYSLDISSAMHPGDNTVTLRVSGKKGSTANVMLWDGVTE